MQTITEKEVNAGLTQASDAAFINAFTADGTPIKISKADLASVVAGVPAKELTDANNLNEINPGLYVWRNAVIPVGGRGANALCLCLLNPLRRERWFLCFDYNYREFAVGYCAMNGPVSWKSIVSGIW